MVDTLSIQINLTNKGNYLLLNDLANGERNYLECSSYNNGKKRTDYCFVGGIAPFSLFYNASRLYICITFNPKIVLGYPPMATDVNNIEHQLKCFVKDKLNIPTYWVKNITLNRIDYKVDYLIKCEEERQILYELMAITPSKLGQVVRTLYETAITYEPKNGYVELIVYDKESQRKRKKEIRYTDYIYIDDVDDDFKGIIRTEVRIKNRKLNYYKYNSNWGLSKELSNYLCYDMKAYFFKQYAEKVWFSEDFYRIDVALDIIRNNSNLSNNMKNKLCTVLKSIRRNGYTKTRNYFGYLKRTNDIQKATKCGTCEAEMKNLENKKLSSSDYATFNNYIKRLRELGINPLTFDRNHNLEKIKNFTKDVVT